MPVTSLFSGSALSRFVPRPLNGPGNGPGAPLQGQLTQPAAVADLFRLPAYRSLTTPYAPAAQQPAGQAVGRTTGGDNELGEVIIRPDQPEGAVDALPTPGLSAKPALRPLPGTLSKVPYQAPNPGKPERVKGEPVSGMAIANGVLGAAGLLSYATAKAPRLAPPPAYTPPVRPAEGMGYDRLQAGRNQIQATQRLAGRGAGADGAAGISARLAALAQAQQAQNQLTGQDAEIYRQDRVREGQERNQAYDANYKTRRSYEETQFNQQNTAYQARRQSGQAMAQSALTYFNQAAANKQQGREAVKNQQNRYKELQLQTLISRRSDATLSAAQRSSIEEQINALIGNGIATDKLAKGGQIGSGMSSSSRTSTRSGSLAQQAEALFQRSMMQVTNNAMRAFSSSIQQVFQAKYTAASGSKRR